MATDAPFSILSDDVILNILAKLENDPHNWARLACVSTKFSSFIHNICCKIKCSQTIPSVVFDLISSATSLPGGWSSLHKLTLCCPGPLHAEFLLKNSDFGVERELGLDENYRLSSRLSTHTTPPSTSQQTDSNSTSNSNSESVAFSGSERSWTSHLEEISMLL